MQQRRAPPYVFVPIYINYTLRAFVALVISSIFPYPYLSLQKHPNTQTQKHLKTQLTLTSYRLNIEPEPGRYFCSINLNIDNHAITPAPAHLARPPSLWSLITIASAFARFRFRFQSGRSHFHGAGFQQQYHSKTTYPRFLFPLPDRPCLVGRGCTGSRLLAVVF